MTSKISIFHSYLRFCKWSMDHSLWKLVLYSKICLKKKTPFPFLIPLIMLIDNIGLPRWLSGKESACQCRKHRRHGFDPQVGKIPWRRKWQPAPIYSPSKLHGQRSLVGYSPWGCKKSGTTERLTTQPHIEVYIRSVESPGSTKSTFVGHFMVWLCCSHSLCLVL